MYVTKINEQEMYLALKEVNKRFDNNVDFYFLEWKRGRLHFRLKTISNKKPGHTLGFPRSYYNKKYDEFINRVKEANDLPIEEKYITKQAKYSHACWHVHGYFFEELFKINPETKIYSLGKKITKESGNWEDICVSEYQGIYKSELCECE